MSHFAKLSEIKIAPTRQRRLFDIEAICSLEDSIGRLGLLHPIVLRESGTELILVAGERRLRAVTSLWEMGGTFSFAGQPVPADHIPYTLLGELSPLAAMEAELEENVCRQDLTWQERALATAALTELRRAQADAAGLPPPTIGAISSEVRGTGGRSQDTTRQELILASRIDDPDIKAAKSVTEAFKILKQKEAAAQNMRLAETVGSTFSNNIHTLDNVDALTAMRALQDNQFDVILTDPPYGIGADNFGNSGLADTPDITHGYDDSWENAIQCYYALAVEGFRITKPEAHLYAFCDIRRFFELHNLFTRAGWQVFTTPLIWHNPTGFRAPWPDLGPQRKYEAILYAIKGKRPVLKMAPDLLTYPRDESLGHRAQKPIGLYTDLLSRSARPGDRVLDPFCGSGTIFPAATIALCQATGFEKDPSAYGIAVGRLREEPLL